MTGFVTKAVHGIPGRTSAHGTLRGPVYDSVAFEFAKSTDIEKAFEGRLAAHSYTRVSNPTVQELEERVAFLAGAKGVVAVSSGMAAISNTIMALAGAGTNIVTTRFLFGNTLSLFQNTLGPWGLEVRYADFLRPESVAAAIDGNTRAVFLETITNPQLEVADIELIAAIAHENGVPVIADGTATTPYLFPSRNFGVDVEVISSTKYMSGGATTIGGLIVDNGIFDWKQAPRLKEAARRYGPHAFIAALRHTVYRDLGACMAPHNAYLQVLGLETMGLRIERSCANTLRLARWLKNRPEVSTVNYPGLETSPSHATAKRLLSKGFGGILTFSLSDRKACFAFMDALQTIRRATNIHDNKTLILHPASTIFCEFDAEEKAAMGVGDAMLRLSVGIEDDEDLITDLERGFAAVEIAALQKEDA
ncbi:aminotransferase class V-fold PLP-dependent enzyme [Telmatospirillum sp.]|uniref:aminotransferase class V-fold PLP-dependent enzyme n=1 Tax=Telmatospirillum sp. TaxID=2079197 RepID=UPI00284D4F81|nr:aminotransferase class V-fold PLP-dependent enzyme [Telmatospirillum sp.]MDR3437437.1 aminotransferase class V-fold PLP-dependent enzyme [Telmatospirillum sp.]